jgi:hypothetical protein
MSAHRLLLSVGPRQRERLSPRDFLWRPRGEPSSMQVSVGPRLEELGAAPPLHVDFMRLAALVFLVDRSVERDRGPGVRWERELELTVPVSDPDRWNAVDEQLAEVLHILTGDTWSLAFVRERAPRRRAVTQVAPAPVVCLFSGGADSLAGAVVAREQFGSLPVLASHFDFPAIAGVQNRLVDALGQLWGQRPEHVRLHLQRHKRQVGSGALFPDEPSRRSRSLLFIALGLAAAAVRDAELWMSENGPTSLNPPLTGERRGSVTTRTTHPAFLDRLAEVLTSLGLNVRLRNPFETLTKGEVLRACADALGDDARAGQLLSMSHSCGKPSFNVRGFDPGKQCGVCFGCLVRRGAFPAAGLTDSTTYIEVALRGDGRRDGWLTDKRRQTIEAVRYRLRRGYRPTDVVALGLPPRIRTAEALELVNRGLAELGAIDIP